MKRSLKSRYAICAGLMLAACSQGSPGASSEAPGTETQTTSATSVESAGSSTHEPLNESSATSDGTSSDGTSSEHTTAVASSPSDASSGLTDEEGSTGAPDHSTSNGETSHVAEPSSSSSDTTEASTVSTSEPVSSGGAEDSSTAPIAEDPLNAAATCTSNSSWTRGENDRMRPGEACVTCHTREGEGPRYAIAGTLFPTGHEPDDCNGVAGASSGARVVITDANGQDHELTPNSAGNFYFNGSLATPYTAKVVSDAGERLMFTPQKDGDCNKCHTSEGTGGAPGRIVVPF